ncbi:hypothetical protein ACVMB0_005556 [Bradyrhizobium sp. USDA 4451]
MHITPECALQAEGIEFRRYQVGHGTFAVMPLFHLIERHVLAAERLHGDDTTIRILAKGKCTTGRIWTYVRDDRPSPGLRRRRRSITPRATDEASIPRSIWPSSPVSCKPIATTASSRCSTRRRRCCRSRRRFCFAHARRGFFELADIEKNAREGKKGKPVSPIALEAVRRLDALFEIERAINGRGADERRAVRQEKSKPLLGDMHAWLLREPRKPSLAPPRS